MSFLLALVPMSAVVVVEVTIVQVIYMIFMQAALVSTTKAVNMPMVFVDQVMRGRNCFRWLLRSLSTFVSSRAIMDMACVSMVVVAIMLIIDVAVMVFRGVATLGPVNMIMIIAMLFMMSWGCDSKAIG